MDERRAFLGELVALRGRVRDWHKVLVAEDLDFMRAVNGLTMAAHMGRQRTLDRKTKDLIMIGALVGDGVGKDHIRIHMESAKRAGATKTEVLEALEATVTCCGVPKFLVGYEVWTELYPVERVEP
jgi:alkylhydroperoxidase/carboxymuconolactone decarboxylase family protein YurZ